MRRAHILQANHSLESPWESVWFDTETHQEQIDHNTVRHRLWFGWAAYRRRLEGDTWSAPTWIRFSSPSTFWAWVEGSFHGRGRLYVFSHNAGFDLPVVDAFGELPRRGWKLTKAVIECPPVILKWRRGKHTIEALDTLNIWRLPLAKLGEQIGVPKLEMPRPDAGEEAWDTYCKGDVTTIMEACLRWWKLLREHRLGSFAPTLAGQAMRAYRHRFMRHKILVDADEDAAQLARMSYLGGRVECYRIGRHEGPIYRLDANGMYPSVMKGNFYPVRLIGHTHRASLNDLKAWCVQGCCIAEVDIDTPEPAYPVVHNGRLIFPINKFRTTLATPELAHALAAGRVVRVYQAAAYEAEIIFDDFVDYFWRERRAAQLRGDHVTDRLLWKFSNSLYGKWGQRGRVYEEVGQHSDLAPASWLEYDADTGTLYKHRAFGGLHQMWRDEGESRESIPAISSHVCSYGRLKLWEYQCQAGRGNLYYSDTDCLWVNQAGRDALAPAISADVLGMLKLEAVEPWVELYGPKDYACASMAKTKGVRKSAAWISHNEIIQEQWSSLVGLVGDGDLSGPTTTLVVKHLHRRYMKGGVTPDGLVLPFSLG